MICLPNGQHIGNPKSLLRLYIRNCANRAHDCCGALLANGPNSLTD